MRISRTNFYPVLETEEQNDEQSAYAFYENNALPEMAPEIEEWHAADEPVANDEAYHPRFRSPALRSYDPGQFSDGSWESHFYMAPNVRFTRTPDKVAAKIEEAAAEEAQQTQPGVETVEQPVQAAQPILTPQLSQAELLQRLREALEDRRRRSEEQQAEVAAAARPGRTRPAARSGRGRCRNQRHARRCRRGFQAERADCPAHGRTRRGRCKACREGGCPRRHRPLCQSLGPRLLGDVCSRRGCRRGPRKAGRGRHCRAHADPGACRRAARADAGRRGAR